MGALTQADLDRLQRRCRDAVTRSRRAAGSLESFYEDSTGDAARFLIGYEAERLLTELLDNAETLAGMLYVRTEEYDTEADFPGILSRLEAVKLAVEKRYGNARRRRIVEKLRNVRGRTPGEAALYLEAAARLSDEPPTKGA